MHLQCAKSNVKCAICIVQFAVYNVLYAVCPSISYSVTQDNSEYNALEHDLAVVNLYFGSSTVYGQTISAEGFVLRDSMV